MAFAQVFFSGAFLASLTAILGLFTSVFLKEKTGKIISLTFAAIALCIAFYIDVIARISISHIVGPELSQIVLFIAVILSIVIFRNDPNPKVNRFESYLLLVLAFSAMLFAVQLQSILVIYLSLEFISISSYILAALNKTEPKSNEAAMKYFIIGAISSALMVYGLSLIYGFSGTEGAPEAGLVFGVVIFLFGLFFKITAFPFHVWAPDVYEGMNTSSLSFIAVAPKITAFIVLAKILNWFVFPFPQATDVIVPILQVIAGASIITGAVGALFQSDLKRIIAYSGISHMGFVLCFFVVNVGEIGPAHYILISYYFFVYVFINAGMFGVITALGNNIGFKGTLEGLKGLGKTNKLLAFSFAVLMLSNAGIPPLAGFFIKYQVFLILITSKAYALAVVGVLGSVIASFYYLKIIKTMYFEEPCEECKKYCTFKLKFSLKALIAVAILVNLLFIYPGFFSLLTFA